MIEIDASIPSELAPLAWLIGLWEGTGVVHYTLGAPGFSHYAQCDGADHWRRARKKAMHMIGED
jgi:hypothetical protein